MCLLHLVVFITMYSIDTNACACYIILIHTGEDRQTVRQIVVYMERSMGTVIAIPPKSDTHRHRRVDYTLTYLPPTRQWKWSFILRVETYIDGVEDTYDAAMQEARSHIDMSQGVRP